MRPAMKRAACVVCGKKFVKVGRRIACPGACAKERQRAKIDEHRKRTAKKPLKAKKCRFCRVEFQPYFGHHSFCSRKCSSNWWNKLLRKAT